MSPGHTPLEVADLIQDIIKDKVVCDVGCGQGEFMQALAKHAKKVTGIEVNDGVAGVARSKGFDVITGDSFYEKLPEADVYYMWTRDMIGVYLKAKEEGTKGTFVFGYTEHPYGVKFLKELDSEERDFNGFKVNITTLQ